MLAANLALPGSVIAGWFAAHIHGLPVLVDLESIDVTLAVRAGSRSRMLNVRRCSGPLPSKPWNAGRVANPVLTILTIVASGSSKQKIETVLDACLTRRILTVKHVEKLLAEPGWLQFRGRQHLMSLLLQRGEGRALFRSQTEARVSRWLHGSGCEGGIPNFKVATPFGEIEVDRAWPESKLALEISPFWTHGSRKTQERDIDRRHALTSVDWTVVEADDRHLVNRRTFEPIIKLLLRELR